MSEYPKIRITDFKKLHAIALKISPLKLGPTYTTIRTHLAEQIFEKALLIINSYVRLIPDFEKKERHQFDFSTLAALSRNLIELSHVYDYFCKDRLSKDELEFRMNLFEIHSSEETKKVFERLGFSEDFVQEIILYSRFVSECELSKNRYFNNLDEKVRNRLKKGNTPFYPDRLERANHQLDQRIESGLYKLFSNNIHSFQLGIQPQRYHTNKGPLSLVSLLFLSMEAAIVYFSSILNSYISLRWKICKQIPDEEKLFVKRCCRKTRLQEWVRYQEDNLLVG